jgi:glycerol transport system ATP-binding protein
MARIEIDNVRHAYGAAPASEAGYALKRIHHVWEDGGAYALLGPSGCGKSTLLNIMSGLVRPSEGRVLFNGKDVTQQPTEKRNIAQVFQFPVVYDTMSVRQNLAFPLRNRRVKRNETRKRVNEMLDVIGLQKLADVRARRLTADQKQKISLARGLVRSDVNAILLDEPLTVIDPQMKWELRAQMRALQRRFGYTMIYVTHDQTEALTFAQTVVVMYEGEIVQAASPQELFERPSHTFVGYFIGSPGMNVMPAHIDGGVAHLGEHRLQLLGAPKALLAKKIELGVRPEYVRLGAEGMAAKVTRVEDIGRLKIVRMILAGREIAAVLKEGEEVPFDARVTFDPAGVNLYADSWRVELTGQGAP